MCEFHQGKLLLHLTIPFEEKPKTNLPSDNLKYYRQRKQMTTRQLAEKLDIVPSTVAMYENGKHPIPYDNPAFKEASVVQMEQIRTIDKSRIDNYLGKVTPREMVAIEKALSVSLAMEQLKKRSTKHKAKRTKE